MPDNPNTTREKFNALPEPVRRWLQSDTVADILTELAQKYDLFGAELEVLPRLVTQLSIGDLKAADFTTRLYEALPILEDKDLMGIADLVERRIFKPIMGTLKSVTGIDTANLATQPRRPQPKAVKPTPTQNTVNLREQGQRSQTTQMEKTIKPRVEKLAPRPTPPSRPAGPRAEESNPEQPFHLSEQQPAPEQEQKNPNS